MTAPASQPTAAAPKPSGALDRLGLRGAFVLLADGTDPDALATARQATEALESEGLPARLLVARSPERWDELARVADVVIDGASPPGPAVARAMASGLPRHTATQALTELATLLRSAVAPPPPLDRPPRVCFVIPRYGEGFSGGAEAHCRIWTTRCHAAGWHVEVATTTTDSMIAWSDALPAGRSDDAGVLVTRFRIDPDAAAAFAAVHHRIDASPLSVSEDETRLWGREGIVEAAFYAHLAERAPDLDFFVFMPATPFLFNARSLETPGVAERAVVIPLLHDEGSAWTAVVRDHLDAAHAILFNTPVERDFARGELGVTNANAFSLGIGFDAPGPVDVPAFRHRHGLDGPYVLCVGRMEHGKNVPLLVEWFAQYTESAPEPLTLALIGSGEPPTGPGVRHLGFVTEADKQAALAGAVALVNPSTNESFSMVLMESWLHGRPVVVHRRCPVTLSHVRRSGGGLAFDDPTQLAAVLAALAADSALADRLGAAGRRYAEARYGMPHVLERFRRQLDLLRGACSYEQAAVRAIGAGRRRLRELRG